MVQVPLNLVVTTIRQLSLTEMVQVPRSLVTTVIPMRSNMAVSQIPKSQMATAIPLLSQMTTSQMPINPMVTPIRRLNLAKVEMARQRPALIGRPYLKRILRLTQRIRPRSPIMVAGYHKPVKRFNVGWRSQGVSY